MLQPNPYMQLGQPQQAPAAPPAYDAPQGQPGMPRMVVPPRPRQPAPRDDLSVQDTTTSIQSRAADDRRADQSQQNTEVHQSFGRVESLRKEFESSPLVRNFPNLQRSYEGLRALSDQGTPSSDMAMVFGFMKMLDETSVVREAEQEQVRNATDLRGRIENYYNRLATGEGLNPEQRADMLSAARDLYGIAAEIHNRRATRFQSLLGEQGIPQERLDTHAPMVPLHRGGEMGAIIDDTLTNRPAPDNPSTPTPAPAPLEGGGDGVTRTNQNTGNQEWGERTPDNASPIRDIEDPVLRGHAARLGQMLANPRNTDEQIRAYANQYFPWNAGGSNLEAALRDRRDPRSELGRWIRQNRGKPVIMGRDWYTRQEERSNAEQNMGRILDTPVGTAAASYFNSATAGLVPPAAEAIGAIDDANNARAGLAGARELNPNSAMAGDIAGVVTAYAGGRAALNAAAPGVAARLSSRPLAAGIGGDAIYGGIRGAAESPDNALLGAVQGAAINAAVGGAARGGARVGGQAIAPTGGSMAPLYAEGVQPSMGQRAGGVINRAEQAFASVPILGAAQRSTRERAIEQFERSVFNRALRNIPEARAGGRAPLLPDGVGPGAQAWDHSYKAFDQAYDSVHSQMRFRLDNRVQQSLVQAQQQAARLHPDSAQRFANILENDVTRVLAQNGGQLSGRELQGVLSNIRSTVRSVSKNPNGDQEFVAALEGLEDALMRGAIRNSPRAAIRDLRRIDRGYAQLMRAERASMSGSANREPGRFSATDLQRAERATGNRRRFLRGDADGANYAAAGQRLGQTVSDSGTGERAAYMAGGLGMIGGGGAAGAGAAGMSPLALLGLAPYAANTLGNMPIIRDGVNAMLAPRRGQFVNGMRVNTQRYIEPLAGASAPAISDPWYGTDY